LALIFWASSNGVHILNCCRWIGCNRWRERESRPCWKPKPNRLAFSHVLCSPNCTDSNELKGVWEGLNDSKWSNYGARERGNEWVQKVSKNVILRSYNYKLKRLIRINTQIVVLVMISL
jgi:hypothetical protein